MCHYYYGSQSQRYLYDDFYMWDLYTAMILQQYFTKAALKLTLIIGLNQLHYMQTVYCATEI